MGFLLILLRHAYMRHAAVLLIAPCCQICLMMHIVSHLHSLLFLSSRGVHTRLLAAHDLGALLARDDTRRLPIATAHELIVLLLAPHLAPN